MIERMKKLTLLVFHKDREKTLADLQDLGVVHIETVATAEIEEIEKLEGEKSLWLRAMNIIHENAMEEGQDTKVNFKEPKEARDAILHAVQEKERVVQRKEALQKEENQLMPWGNFEWGTIEKLKRKNIFCEFYTARKRDFLRFDFKKMAVEVIREAGGLVYFVVLSYRHTPDVPFEQVVLPHISLAELKKEKTRLLKREHEIKEKLATLKSCMPLLEEGLAAQKNVLNTAIATHSFDPFADGKIIKLTGWFPNRIESRVTGFLDKKHFSYFVEQAKLKDKVPVVLKNKKYPQIFETITRIFQLPNYHELDLTPLIAVFYPIFFAYCLGDAGYGLVLVIISAVGYFTFFKNARNISALVFILGLMTTVVGTIKSGTVFGLPIAQHKDIPFFSWLSQYIFVTDNQDFIFNAFNVALMIGVVQILVGVISSIVKRVKIYGWEYGIGNFGKLIIIIGTLVLFLGAMQKVAPFDEYVRPAAFLTVAGVLLVLFFHDPDIPVFRRIGGGILPLYFIFTGFMGDTLSYIRLFALGIASGILGLVINQIGMQMMDGAGIAMTVVSVIFLVFGHTFNLALACLGAFVHPLRLTFVEFYNNAGFEGGGVEYKPFKKEIA